MLAHKIIVKIITGIVSSLLMFASLMIMTRHVFSEYGVMMYGWSIVGLMNTLTDLGFDAATVKSISQKKDLNTCISTHLFLKLILIGIMALITVAYLAISVLSDHISTENATIVIMFLIYYAAAGIAWVFIRTFDGRLEAAKSSFVQASDTSMRSLVLIVIALAGSSATVLSFGYVAGAVFSIIIALYLFRKIGYRPVAPSYVKDYLLFAKPVAIGLLLIAAMSFIDRVMVGSFCGTDELGYYSVAMGVAFAATSIGLALNYVLLPKFSELVSVNEHDSLKNILWSSEKYLSLLLLPVVVFAMVFGTDIATVLFGANTAPAGTVISILAAYIYLYIILGILTQILLSTGHNGLYRNAAIVFATSTFIMLIVLVPDNIGSLKLAGLGANGAAIAVTLGYLIFTIITSYYVKASMKLSLHKGLIHQFIAATVVFLLAFITKREFSFRLIELLLFLLICYVLFIGISYAFREITKDDIASMLRVLSLKSIKECSNDKKD
ncbi:polysaccharide biosynthesis protein [Candidatus Methanoplasma termitum]|uniref:Polysaccharide biosynthesis protein n=1 Tax=Candidatus Methanoplasma termitum TaxID=1577791 RepID=A0A0A7LHP2_9ARCH|nr:oligosaccharide flippase family protein [Candidatus Methanoplasma termitum]AIZ57026.1 polysaccharide biosynthesis protein [Candidatus Methanoplasma termitum]